VGTGNLVKISVDYSKLFILEIHLKNYVKILHLKSFLIKLF